MYKLSKNIRNAKTNNNHALNWYIQSHALGERYFHPGALKNCLNSLTASKTINRLF